MSPVERMCGIYRYLALTKIPQVAIVPPGCYVLFIVRWRHGDRDPASLQLRLVHSQPGFSHLKLHFHQETNPNLDLGNRYDLLWVHRHNQHRRSKRGQVQYLLFSLCELSLDFPHLFIVY